MLGVNWVYIFEVFSNIQHTLSNFLCQGHSSEVGFENNGMSALKNKLGFGLVGACVYIV